MYLLGFFPVDSLHCYSVSRHSLEGGHIVVIDTAAAHMADGLLKRMQFVGACRIDGWWKTLERNDEAVVATDFADEIGLDLVERHSLGFQFVVKCGGLLAGVGNIERELTALGIEDEAGRLAALHDVHEIGVLSLIALADAPAALFLLYPFVMEFETQHVESAVEVALLEYCLTLEGHAHQKEQRENDFLHFNIHKICGKDTESAREKQVK